MKIKKALIILMLLNNLLQASDLSLLVAERVSTFAAAENDKTCRFLFPEQAQHFVAKITNDTNQQKKLKEQLKNSNIVCIAVRSSGESFVKGYVFYYIPKNKAQSDGEASALFVYANDEPVMQKLMSHIMVCGLKSLTIRPQVDDPLQKEFLLSFGFKDVSTRREHVFTWFKQ